MRQLTCIFAGGGTGGHLFPGIAVAEELVARGVARRIVFAGSNRSVERPCVERAGFQHCALPAEPLAHARRHPLRCAWRNFRAVRLAKQLLHEVKPDVVIGLGGFASAPVLFAARGCGIPFVLLEQNVIPGRATQWFARDAARVCTSFDGAASELPSRSRVCCVGNPVRRAIAAQHRNRSEPTSTSVPTILVLGGSQGATPLNEAMLAAAEMLSKGDFKTRFREGEAPAEPSFPANPARQEPCPPGFETASRHHSNWKIIHQTGAEQTARVRSRYSELGIDCDVAPFFEDLAARYSQAAVVVSRAGATTLAELACTGIPAVLVPYPHADRNHQLRNAEVFQRAGAAKIAEQRHDAAATAQAIVEQLAPLLSDRTLLTTMHRAMHTLARPDASALVVDSLLEVAKSGECLARSTRVA